MATKVPVRTKRGGRYDYKAAERKKIIEEYDAAPKGEAHVVAEKYGVSSPLIAYWRKSRRPHKGDRLTDRKVHPMNQRLRVAAEARQPGADVKAIAAREGVSPWTVEKWRRLVDLKRRGRTQAYSPAVREMVLADTKVMSISAVAAKHSLHYTTIYEWMNQEKAKETGGLSTKRAYRASRGKRLAAVVEATNKALQTMNGDAGSLHTGASKFIREAILRLRAIGVDIASIEVKGDQCKIKYNSEETIEL